MNAKKTFGMDELKFNLFFATLISLDKLKFSMKIAIKSAKQIWMNKLNFSTIAPLKIHKHIVCTKLLQNSNI